jgi:hypothetical protein
MNEGSDPKNSAAGAVGVPETAPTSRADGAGVDWEMPAPVFRVSEGVTVTPPAVPVAENAVPDTEEALAKLYAPPEETGDNPSDPGGPPPDPILAAAIAPQPDISEDFELPGPGNAIPVKKPGNPALRFVFTFFGLLGMLLFLAVFLAVVYFLFFYKPDPGAFN